jgi:hypothetical protein
MGCASKNTTEIVNYPAILIDTGKQQPAPAGYPQKLWITLWMTLQHQCQKPAATAGLLLWLNFNQPSFVFKNNKL